MRENEFIKRVKRIGKKRGVEVRVDKKRGKVRHVTLYFDERSTIVSNPKDELTFYPDSKPGF